MKNYDRPDEAQKPESISYFLHQGMLYTQERHFTFIITVLCIIIALLAVWGGTETVLRHIENQKWLDYLAQYDFTDYEYTQDGRGLNIIGDGNGVDYSVPTPESANANQEEPEYSPGESDSQA